MLTPSEREFEALAANGFNLVPVCREISADMETPVSAFLKVARGDYSFLLESVRGGEKWGRYTFLGTEPALVIRARPESHGFDPARTGDGIAHGDQCVRGIAQRGEAFSRAGIARIAAILRRRGGLSGLRYRALFRAARARVGDRMIWACPTSA